MKSARVRAREMAGRGRTPNQIRAVAVARGDNELKQEAEKMAAKATPRTAIKVAEEREHNEYPPSSFPDREKCPCFQGTPVPSMTDDPRHPANVGTRVHENIRYEIAKGPKPMEPMDDEEREMIRRGLDFFKAHFADQTVEVEAHVAVTDGDFESLTSGTVDLLICYDFSAMIVDWKTGRSRKGYKAQLAAYALGVMEEHGYEYAECVTPFLRFDPCCDMGRDVWKVTKDEARKIVLGVLASIKNPAKQPNPCDACSYCSHKDACKALTAIATKTASGYAPDQIGTNELGMLTEWHPSKITDPAQMAVAKRMAKILKGWIDSVNFHATELAKQGAIIPGYALKPGRNKREIENIIAAYQRSGLPAEQFLGCCSVSVPELSKAMADAAGIAKTGKKATEHMEKALGALIQTKAGEQYLAEND